MKLWLIAPALTAFALLAFDAAAESAPGAYEAAAAPSAQDCANRCAADGLCMSWTYADVSGDAACSLSAVAPMSPAAPGALMGLNPRAPDFARAFLADQNAAVEKVTTATPPTERAEAKDGQGLLGGPNDALPLRSRLAFETGTHR
jgi:uncharacterized protein (DUF1501 family)